MALCCPPTYPTWRLKRRELDGGDGRLPILGIINPVNFPSEFFSCVNDASDLFAIMPILLCAEQRNELEEWLDNIFQLFPHPVQDLGTRIAGY